MASSTGVPGGAVALAILDEPPFCWLADGHATGCDVEVARHALAAVDITDVTVEQVSFADRIPHRPGGAGRAGGARRSEPAPSVDGRGGDLPGSARRARAGPGPRSAGPEWRPEMT